MLWGTQGSPLATQPGGASYQDPNASSNQTFNTEGQYQTHILNNYLMGEYDDDPVAKSNLETYLMSHGLIK